jgi:transcriptional regulator with XRE-family HTH domain
MSQSRGKVALLGRLGLRIKVRRTHCRMSQADLADAAGLDRSYVSRVERGVHNITVLTLVQIAEALDTAPSQLLDSAIADDDLIAGPPRPTTTQHPRPGSPVERPAHGAPGHAGWPANTPRRSVSPSRSG